MRELELLLFVVEQKTMFHCTCSALTTLLWGVILIGNIVVVKTETQDWILEQNSENLWSLVLVDVSHGVESVSIMGRFIKYHQESPWYFELSGKAIDMAFLPAVSQASQFLSRHLAGER